MIRFRHGNREKINAQMGLQFNKQSSSFTNNVATQSFKVSGISRQSIQVNFQDLPQNYRPTKLTEEQMQLINTGGAEW